MLDHAASDAPHSLRMEVRVRMESGAVVLDGDQGAAPVLRAGTRGTTTVARMYPKTISVRVAVAGMGVLTPEGNVARTGALLPPSSSILGNEEEGMFSEASGGCTARADASEASLG